MPRRRPRRSSRIISLLGVLLVAVGVWYLWRQLPATPPWSGPRLLWPPPSKI